MRLGDLFSSGDLSIYPQISLVIFLGIFAVAVLRVARQPRHELDRMARLPITGEPEREGERNDG